MEFHEFWNGSAGTKGLEWNFEMKSWLGVAIGKFYEVLGGTG